jgi:hypothetical protein
MKELAYSLDFWGVDGGENLYQIRRFKMDPQTDSRRTTMAISPWHLRCFAHLRRRKDRHATLTQFAADGFNFLPIHGVNPVGD